MGVPRNVCDHGTKSDTDLRPDVPARAGARLVQHRRIHRKDLVERLRHRLSLLPCQLPKNRRSDWALDEEPEQVQLLPHTAVLVVVHDKRIAGVVVAEAQRWHQPRLRAGFAGIGPKPGADAEPDFGTRGPRQQQDEPTDNVDSVAEAVDPPVENIE